MAAESNTGFHQDGTWNSALHRHAITFQSGAINSTSEMIHMGNYFGMSAVNTSSASMMIPGSSSMINSSPGLVQVQTSNSSGASSLVLDSISGLKHDTGFAVEWSVEEQYKLEEGLLKYADEPSIMKYVKIAAMLRDKTVRDVALRCRWMTRKRRKAEECHAGKKVSNRKDKLGESSTKINMTSTLPQSIAGYPLLLHHMDRREPILFEGISATAKHLLEQNAQAFSQITANLSMFKLHDNINLFCCARNNITTILNDMRDTPGMMSQMLPLPVCINEELANSILPNTTQSMMFGSPSGILLKQEPRC
ncbi:hypothetical protein K2173_006801 [Erythroxylum novogranatense]|uniref:Uncharacterized protein n=1 Tax=Erythroxylum novogranatense TaxID=1862640 RepID=A0AAV8SXT2_9ROSI|nr:hypothetical protein K2173_006801 [Erythroxylum novogranatense]